MQYIQDNIPSLVVASSTAVTLAATNGKQPTSITIGGQSYYVPTLLTLNTASVGANGLDAGTLGASQLWYVYAVVNQSTFVVALVASLNTPVSGPTHPSGYGTAEKMIGTFTTNGSSAITSATGASVGYPVSAAQVVGSTAGTAPASGMIGQLISAQTTRAGEFTIASGSAVNTTSGITLTPGTYIISGIINLETAAGASVSGGSIQYGIANSTTSFDTSVGVPNAATGGIQIRNGAAMAASTVTGLIIPAYEFVCPSTTILYGIVSGTISGTVYTFGYISAVRNA